MLLASHAECQTPFLAATSNKSAVAQGEQFQITYTFNGQGRSFQGPDLREFNLLGGPSQSTNMQVINGNFSQSISFTYYLSGKNTGTFKIGPASIEAEGKRIASNVIQMTVTKGAPPSQQNRQGDQQSSETGISSKNIFVRAIPEKTSCEKGEGIRVTFRLYSNLSVMDFAIPKMPSLDGFWNQDIALPQTLDRTTEIIDGQRFTVWDIKKLILFPQQSGTLTIDPMEVECLVRVKVNSQRSMDPFSIFNDPFFGMGGVKDVKHSFKSAPVKIQVRNLPANPPAGFTGAVGSLKFEAFMDRSNVKVNESVNLKLKISGNGNLKLAELPEPELPADLETYDPKVIDNFKAGSNGVSGSKSAEYLIIPRIGGEFEIPEIYFSYYDLGKRSYVSQKAGPFVIKVTGGDGKSATVSAGRADKSEVKMIGMDIRYIKFNPPAFMSRFDRFYGSGLFYTFSLSPFLLFGIIAFWRRKQLLEAGNTSALRIKNAGSMARKRLTNARKCLQSGQEQLVFDEIQKALWGYLSDRFSVPNANLSKEKATEVFDLNNIPTQLTDTFIRTIDDCEMARYGGSSMGISGKMIYEKAEALISEIETSIKS